MLSAVRDRHDRKENVRAVSSGVKAFTWSFQFVFQGLLQYSTQWLSVEVQADFALPNTVLWQLQNRREAEV